MNKNKSMMKKVCYCFLVYLIVSCSKDSTSTNQIREIQLSYSETEINTTFRTAGSVAPVILDWDGEPGTYSIASSSEILRRGAIVFDTLTGQFSWDKDFPVGTYDFTITAKSDEATATVEILMTNTFIKGFFSGGFVTVDFDSEEGYDPSAIPHDYSLRLNDDGSIYIQNYSNPAFEASGTWEIIKGNTLLVAFISNLSGGAATYLRGTLSNSILLPTINGRYGSSIDENQEIEDAIGAFRFEWD